MDEFAFNEEVFGIIEPALEAAGYIVLEGAATLLVYFRPMALSTFRSN